MRTTLRSMADRNRLSLYSLQPVQQLRSYRAQNIPDILLESRNRSVSADHVILE